jgi:release factor glutamine methyltransferase
MPRTIQNTLLQDAARLTEALALDASGARIEVQSLLQQVLNVSRAYLLAHPERCLNDSEQARYEELLFRRLRGEPIAYILGEREFFGLMFKVTPATLIPRPETELLVELALQRIPQHRPSRLLDLGTGSGAIALSIAHARPDVEVVAVDASSEALAVARENAQRLGLSNAVFVQSDWYAALDAQRFDLIVSNPPYVAAGDPHLQHGDLRFEPSSALASGDDGLDDIRRIVTHTKAYLSPEGWLLLEHGYDQAKQVRELMQQAGFNEIFSACDLAGIERVSGGRA